MKQFSRQYLRLIWGAALFMLFSQTSFGQRQMETLSRGVVAVNTSGDNVLVQWRKFGSDPADIAFNVYAKVDEGEAIKQNDLPISGKTNFLIKGVNTNRLNQYYVVPVIKDIESDRSEVFTLHGAEPYFSLPLNIPDGGTTPDKIAYKYSANDCSVGDLDGDGNYEIILKWDPSNSHDNSHSGYTGNVIIDAYQLDGTQLWRIDLGRNIRAGAHYTQFMVYDLDGDGKSEMVCKTADGTVDGLGKTIGDEDADYRNSTGRVLNGPEFLTVFNGETGEAMATTNYIPQRYPGKDNPSPNEMDMIWGDDYGNRIDRFLACVAYLDGKRPSVVMCRGYYTRTVLAAFDWRNGKLEQRWVFDTLDQENSEYAGQGNHNLSVADADNDGKDEIIYGSMAVDDDGTGLYSTGLGHGDAMHVSDLDPTHPGMEAYVVHEEYPNPAGIEFRDLETGEAIWSLKGHSDIGRGVAFDIDPNYPGAECWASDGRGVYSAQGDHITSTYPEATGGGATYNMAAWWDGDLLRELVDKTVITKWNWENKTTERLYNVFQEGVSSNNGTKSNPCLIADIWGDWREEIIYRKSDNSELRIFTTPIESDNSFYTLMHDSQYRLSIAWQNVAYNQPAHTSFFLGYGMHQPAVPDAEYVSVTNPYTDDTSTSMQEQYPFTNQKLNVFPCPADQYVKVALVEGFGNKILTISNMNGQLVDIIRDCSKQIDVSEYPAGIYVAKLLSNESRSFTKFIKK
jgi:rhamnogalacturonan endolyase